MYSIMYNSYNNVACILTNVWTSVQDSKQFIIVAQKVIPFFAYIFRKTWNKKYYNFEVNL